MVQTLSTEGNYLPITDVERVVRQRTKRLQSTILGGNMVQFVSHTIPAAFLPPYSIDIRLRATKRNCSTLHERLESNSWCRRHVFIPMPDRQSLTTPATKTHTQVKMTSSEPSAKYEPSDDDRAEVPSDKPTELTLSQQLLLKQYENQVESMSGEDCRQLAIDIARQMMVKDNILKSILKEDIDFRVDMPDPDKMQPPSEDSE